MNLSNSLFSYFNTNITVYNWLGRLEYNKIGLFDVKRKFEREYNKIGLFDVKRKIVRVKPFLK